MVDLEFTNHGSIGVLEGATEAGQSWMDEHLDPDAMTWGKGVVVEPRFIRDILEGAAADGLTYRVFP